jgi:hypothetical protein
MLRKIAKWYLYILSVAYVLVGILACVGAIVGYINTPKFIENILLTPLLIIGLTGPYVMVFPLPLLYGFSLDQIFGTLPYIIPIILGVMALTLGLVGIRASRQLYNRAEGTAVLYLLIAMSISMTLYNVSHVETCTPGELISLCIKPIFILTGIIQSFLMIIALIILKKYTGTNLPVNTQTYGKA